VQVLADSRHHAIQCVHRVAAELDTAHQTVKPMGVVCEVDPPSGVSLGGDGGLLVAG
jgi:hypothetical protein